MATAAQVLANRENATRSTGPRTDAGKQTARFNALRHGLTSRQVVLEHESTDEWQEFRDSIVKSLSPATDAEQAIAVTVAETYWRLMRLYRTERSVLESRMNAVADAHPEITEGDDALAIVFTDPAEMKRMSLLLRYITSAERAHNKALAEFEKMQKLRRRAEEEQAWIEQLAAAEPRTAAAASPSIGFVSQTGHAPERAALPFAVPAAFGPAPQASGGRNP